MKTLATTSTAAEGIYYDADSDEIIQTSRSSNQLNAYPGITALPNGSSLNVYVPTSASSNFPLQSPRDIVLNGDTVVDSDNADVDGDTKTPDSRWFIFTRSSSSLTLRNTVTTDLSLGGIEFVGNNLYAVVDKINQLAVAGN